jgi:hypothetical protein
MKRKNSIKCLFLLSAILFSFFVSAYNTLHQPAAPKGSHALVNVNKLNNELATDNLLFEEPESENDVEDFLSELFLIVAFEVSSSRVSTPPAFLKNKAFSSQSPPAPIYLSIGVFRI